MTRWEIFYTTEFHKNQTKVLQEILKSENCRYDLIEDQLKVMKLTKGGYNVLVMHFGKIVGSTYYELSDYLGAEGLRLC